MVARSSKHETTTVRANNWLVLVALFLIAVMYLPAIIVNAAYNPRDFLDPTGATLNRDRMTITLTRETSMSRKWPWLVVWAERHMEAVTFLPDEVLTCPGPDERREYEVIMADEASGRPADTLTVPAGWIGRCLSDEHSTLYNVTYQIQLSAREGHWLSWLPDIPLMRQVDLRTVFVPPTEKLRENFQQQQGELGEALMEQKAIIEDLKSSVRRIEKGIIAK